MPIHELVPQMLWMWLTTFWLEFSQSAQEEMHAWYCDSRPEAKVESSQAPGAKVLPSSRWMEAVSSHPSHSSSTPIDGSSPRPQRSFLVQWTAVNTKFTGGHSIVSRCSGVLCHKCDIYTTHTHTYTIAHVWSVITHQTWEIIVVIKTAVKHLWGAGKMAQQLKALLDFSDDTGSIPNANMVAHNHGTPVPGDSLTSTGTQVVHRYICWQNT